MRQLALLGLVLSVLLAAITVGVIDEDVHARRTAQDRSLQAAVSAEVALVSNGEHQSEAALSLMLVNPAVRAILADRHLSPAIDRADLRDAGEALAAIKAAALLELSDACLDSGSGRQLVCAGTGRSILFPASLGRQFAALARTSRTGEGSGVFLSPVTHEPSVALLAPFLAGGRLLGFAHLDVSIADTVRSFVVRDTPGVSVGLASYVNGRLLLNSGPEAATRHALGSSGEITLNAAKLSTHPLDVLHDGHRAMVAALPLTLGPAHQTAAAFATARAMDPTFANTIGTAEVAWLALALVMLVGSIAVLSRSQRRMARELSTDALTLLRNRRALMADLPRACQQASERLPAYLWFFDLNGFKRYNDSFGHVAGDRLLTRLSGRLRTVIKPYGLVYRLGGDEFCVIITAPVPDPHALFAHAREALSETGGAFTIDAAGGAVEIPREATDAEHALRLADQRMYGEKAGNRAGAAELITAVLHAALAQRHPDLSEHSDDVAGDVQLLASSIGLDEEAVELIVKAGDLHDVGKLGIPDEIISKPGPLTASEWDFMKQHTVMGEQIIAAAGPSLGPIGPLVRASHERWDGTGYPDHLKGERIPLGARIITICDSFRAMLDERVYKPAMSVEEALTELRRCAGTQFDPNLVEIFCGIVAERTSRRRIPSEAA
jgi:diguanylate cyclase (GGDEF)-like protein